MNHKAVIPLAELVRTHSISCATYFNWRSNYTGTNVAELKQMTELKADLA